MYENNRIHNKQVIEEGAEGISSIMKTLTHAPHNIPNCIYTHTNNQQALKSGHLSNELYLLVLQYLSLLVRYRQGEESDYHRGPERPEWWQATGL